MKYFDTYNVYNLISNYNYRKIKSTSTIVHGQFDVRNTTMSSQILSKLEIYLDTLKKP